MRDFLTIWLVLLLNETLGETKLVVDRITFCLR